MKKALNSALFVILGMMVMYFFNKIENPKPNHNYFKTTEDYLIEDVGQIKKGTLIKLDQSFSEGFTRYILYLNIHDEDSLIHQETDYSDEIMPYWCRKR